jgi:hypothetical protein
MGQTKIKYKILLPKKRLKKFVKNQNALKLRKNALKMRQKCVVTNASKSLYQYFRI